VAAEGGGDDRTTAHVVEVTQGAKQFGSAHFQAGQGWGDRWSPF
jgi:hypothetical protein